MSKIITGKELMELDNSVHLARLGEDSIHARLIVTLRKAIRQLTAVTRNPCPATIIEADKFLNAFENGGKGDE